jgi:hypothetical protein
MPQRDYVQLLMTGASWISFLLLDQSPHSAGFHNGYDSSHSIAEGRILHFAAGTKQADDTIIIAP